MPLPKRNYTGQVAKVSMMEFRKKPGETIDFVAHGMTIEIEKNGKVVAVLAGTNPNQDTVVHPDGTITGAIPLTFRAKLGNGGYGK